MDSTDAYDCPDEPDPSTDNGLLLPETPETSGDDPGEDSDIQGRVTQRAECRYGLRRQVTHPNRLMALSSGRALWR